MSETDQSKSVLRLEPLRLQVSSPLVAFFGTRTDFLQTNILHPVILAYRKIPQDSDVFRLIDTDDVEGLDNNFKFYIL